MRDPIVIDCDSCVAQHSSACDDCLVSYLCEREPDDAVLIEVDELRTLRRLQAVGLAPALRHRRSG